MHIRTLPQTAPGYDFLHGVTSMDQAESANPGAATPTTTPMTETGETAKTSTTATPATTAKPAEDRVAIDYMEQDPHLSHACALTAIAMMGFSSVASYREYTTGSSTNASTSPSTMPSQQNLNLVGRWLANSTSPMASPAESLLLGKRTVEEAASVWGVSREGVAEWERNRVSADPDAKVLDAIRPFLNVDCAVSNDGVVVRRLALATDDVTELPKHITADHVRRFRQIVETLQRLDGDGVTAPDRHSMMDEFGAFVRALFACTAGSLTERYLAARCARRLYASDGGGDPDADSKYHEYTLASMETLPAPLGKVRWTEWALSTAAVSDLAAEKLGLASDPGHREDSGERQTRSQAAAYLLWSIMGDQVVRPGQSATDACVQELIRKLWGACVDIPPTSATLGDVHDSVLESVGTAAPQSSNPPDEGNGPLQSYIRTLIGSTPDAGVAGDKPARSFDSFEASKQLVAILDDPALADNLSTLVADNQIQGANMPGTTQSDALRLYNATRSCFDKNAVLKRVRLVAATAKSTTPDTDVAKFNKQLTDKLLAEVEKSARARFKERADGALTSLRVKFDKIRQQYIGGESKSNLDDYYLYIMAVFNLIDEIHPVRVVITIRTGGFEGVYRQLAPLTAARFIAVKGLKVLLPRWAARVESMCVPVANAAEAKNQPSTSKMVGPFYMLMSNGSQIKDTVEGNLNTIMETIDGDGLGPRPAPHYVYSAYGLSGAGKTRTLLVGDGSVLQTIVDKLSTLKEESPGTKFRSVHVAVMDVYGEVGDPPPNIDNAGNLRTDKNPCDDVKAKRRHTARYLSKALSLSADDEASVNALDGLGGPVYELTEFPQGLDGGAEVPVEQHFFEFVKDIKTLPEAIARLSACKREHNFAKNREEDDPIIHIRPTPNNDESSRAHTAIALSLRGENAEHELARITLLDMAGAEDVDAIQDAYFEHQTITTKIIRMNEKLKKAQIPKIDGAWKAVKEEANALSPDVSPTKRTAKVRDPVAELCTFLNYPVLNEILDDTPTTLQNRPAAAMDNGAKVLDQLGSPSDETHFVDTFRAGPWSRLAIKCNVTREIVSQVLACPPSAPALSKSVLAYEKLIEMTRLVDSFREGFRTSHAMNDICNTITGSGRAKGEARGRVVCIRNSDFKLMNAFKKLIEHSPKFKKGTGLLRSQFAKFVNVPGIGEEMSTGVSDLRSIFDGKDPAFAISGDYIIHRAYEKDPTVGEYMEYLKQTKRFIQMYAIFYVLMPNDKQHTITSELFVEDYRKKLNVLRAQNDKNISKVPPLEEKDMGANAVEYQLSVSNKLGEVSNKWSQGEAALREQCQDFRSQVVDELGMYQRQGVIFDVPLWLRTFLSDSGNELVGTSRGGAPQPVRQIGPPRAGVPGRKAPLPLPNPAPAAAPLDVAIAAQDHSTGLELSTRYVQVTAAYEAFLEADAKSKDARNSLQCPLRFQGRFIANTIEDVKNFARSLAEDKNTPVSHPAWIRSIMGDTSGPATGAMKFIQFVAVRSDFQYHADSANSQQVEDSLERKRASARRQGMIDSINFAQTLNPLGIN